MPFYIDDYNSKTITNSPPKKEDRIELDKAKKEMEAKQLSIFWYLAGITIANNFTEVKSLLSKYGYSVVNEEDSAAAMADMLGTVKWTKFVKEFGEIMESTIDEQIVNKINGTDESGWTEALISVVGSAGSSSLNLSASAKSLETAKENAKDQMVSGLSAMLAEKEKLKTALLKAKEESKQKNNIWIALLIVAILIIGYVLYKRYKARKNGDIINILNG